MNANDVRKLKKFLDENKCRKAFLENFHLHFCFSKESTFSDFLCFVREEHVCGAIIAGFPWGSTKEGREYWMELSNSFKNQMLYIMEKSERNRIYVKVLELLKKDLEENELYRAGFCCHLGDAMYQTNSPYHSKVDPYAELKKEVEKSEFPELVKHRPDSFEIMNYWFRKNDEGMQKRIQIIEQAIKETE